MKTNSLILTTGLITKVFMFTLLMISYSSAVLANTAKTEQAKLDKACESARQTALEPRKKEIFQECLTKFKKGKSVCQQEADAYNGNRINGAPMFYELPACVKAFDFRKK